jgi:hypothetical protein
MGPKPTNERISVSSGNGMLLGMGVGIIFAPLWGPLGLMLCAAIGLVAGAAIQSLDR